MLRDVAPYKPILSTQEYCRRICWIPALRYLVRTSIESSSIWKAIVE